MAELEQKALSYTAAEIDSAIGMARNALQKSGGAMTGPITLYADPTEDMQPASKQYVDNSTPKDVVKTVNGVAPDESGNVKVETGGSDGVYELIETITLTEDTAQVLRTAEPDGTPYSFKKIRILSKVARASAQASINFWAADDCLISGRIYLNPSNETTYGTTHFEIDCGMFKGMGSYAVNSQYSTIGMDSAPYTRGSSFINAIEMLKLTTDNNSVQIPAGSIFTIYGVRV